MKGKVSWFTIKFTISSPFSFSKSNKVAIFVVFGLILLWQSICKGHKTWFKRRSNMHTNVESEREHCFCQILKWFMLRVLNICELFGWWVLTKYVRDVYLGVDSGTRYSIVWKLFADVHKKLCDEICGTIQFSFLFEYINLWNGFTSFLYFWTCLMKNMEQDYNYTISNY